ncbi:alpha/beta hydrolase [Deinococcus sonorensis]|uniref:Alpha/beta hydrolase n=2 Tax=Deinococcus sonorensis TaxID=309891 RepID=A0AAU7U829_9DEIO
MTAVTPELGWHHIYQAGQPDAPTLFLLHGTGGNEQSLLPLAPQVAPGWNVLSVRGRSLEEGFPRFFRRFDALTYDQDQIRSESAALATFLQDAAAQYGFAAKQVTALGFSNGANIGLALLLLHPDALAGAVLLRPVVPLQPLPAAPLEGKRVLLLDGARDPFRPAGAAIAPHLQGLGAQVTAQTLPAGHDLTQTDLLLTRDWLAGPR